MNRRAAGPTVIGIALALLLCLLVVPMLVVGGTAMLFAGGDGSSCGSTAAAAVQPTASNVAANSIPANYLHWFQFVGLQYNVPWTILAGIGKVESDDGQTTLPGVNSGTNAFGAAGPMQIGIEGASGNAWATYATVEDGNPPASVYDPADAIAAAAKYLIAHGVQQNVPEAIFAYNHADWYVQEVLSWASTYASGGYTISEVTPNGDGTADDSVAVQHHLQGGQRARLLRRAQRDRGHRRQLRRGPARQALPVGRHRAGRVRLLGAGHDGLPSRPASRSRAPRRSSGSSCRTSPPPRCSPATWCSSPAETAP